MTANAQTPSNLCNCPDCQTNDCPAGRELAAVRGQLEESAKTGLKYMAQAAEEMRRAERAESALAAALASDFVVVPREPSIGMMHAGRDARNAAIWLGQVPPESDSSVMDSISYKAMIAAAEGK